MANKKSGSKIAYYTLCRLRSGVAGMVDSVKSAFDHYSKWDNLKELFVIPYKKGDFKSNGKLFPDNPIKTKKYLKTSTIESTTTPKIQNTGGKVRSYSAASKSSTSTKVHSKATPSTRSSTLHSGDRMAETVSKKPASKTKEEEDHSQEIYFAHSKEPRKVRPPQVKLKVGQVVKHEKEGYIGVIIGWDEVAMVRTAHLLALFQ